MRWRNFFAGFCGEEFVKGQRNAGASKVWIMIFFAMLSISIIWIWTNVSSEITLLIWRSIIFNGSLAGKRFKRLAIVRPSCKHSTVVWFLISPGPWYHFIVYFASTISKLLKSTLFFSNSRPKNYEWDYRWTDYPATARDVKNSCDQSVATYKGHSVLRTLVRCYFSPEYRWVWFYFDHKINFSEYGLGKS